MSNELATQVKNVLRLRDVMEFYGVKFNSRGFAVCPFHREKTASLSIKNEHYKCFGCGAYGSVIDFVMNLYGIKFNQAIVRLDIDFHLGLVGRRPNRAEQIQHMENKRIERVYRRWQAELQCEYLTLCEVRSVLYTRFLNGEEWLEGIVKKLDVILDDFSGEEARAWQMAITPYTPENIS